jgi:hypothetical protein
VGNHGLGIMRGPSGRGPQTVELGSSGLEMARREYAERLDAWARWNDLSLRAQGGTEDG